VSSPRVNLGSGFVVGMTEGRVRWSRRQVVDGSWRWSYGRVVAGEVEVREGDGVNAGQRPGLLIKGVMGFKGFGLGKYWTRLFLFFFGFGNGLFGFIFLIRLVL
jgi:hypothetical protein